MFKRSRIRRALLISGEKIEHTNGLYRFIRAEKVLQDTLEKVKKHLLCKYYWKQKVRILFYMMNHPDVECRGIYGVEPIKKSV